LNVGEALASVVPWADEVIVFDSFSRDGTLDIAEKFGVKVVQRQFDNFSKHKNWALDNLPLRNEWVFQLDADERVPEDLAREIDGIVRSGAPPFDGYYVGRRIYFMGKWARHGGFYPNYSMRFFRHRLGRYEDRVVHEHIILNGRVGYLRSDMIHQDRRLLDRYFDRHNVYSTMEAQEVVRLLNQARGETISSRLFVRGPESRRLLKELAYRYLPCRALFKFFWMYLIQGGFLDGRLGFRYSVLQMFYEYQVSLKALEFTTAGQATLPERSRLETDAKAKDTERDVASGEVASGMTRSET
jgi:glycosyltransferase involved in cell wall biosynthesis